MQIDNELSSESFQNEWPNRSQLIREIIRFDFEKHVRLVKMLLINE